MLLFSLSPFYGVCSTTSDFPHIGQFPPFSLLLTEHLHILFPCWSRKGERGCWGEQIPKCAMRNHVFSKWFRSEAFFFAKKCNLFCVWGPEVKKLSYSLAFKPLLKVTTKEVFRIVFPKQFYRYIVAKKELPHNAINCNWKAKSWTHRKKHLYCRSYVPISLSCGSCQVGQQALSSSFPFFLLFLLLLRA